ncbi:TonB-dependent receptor domain-containing protein [Gemmatimonadota bacterium]
MLRLLSTLVILLYALGSPLSLSSQTREVTGSLEGWVTAAEDGRPLTGVSARIHGLEAEAFTDSSGRYRFERVPAGSHTLTLRVIGYLPEAVPVAVGRGETVRLDMALRVSPVAVEEILVSARSALRREVPISRTGNALTVVGADEIEEMQYETLDDALRDVPGLVVSRSGSQGNNTYLRMRGFTNKHVLVLVDGVRVTNPTEFNNEFFIDNLLLDDVAQVEVLRGPQSGIYGSDAMSGVINLVTKRGQGASLLSGYVEGGSQGTVRLGAGMSGSVDRLSASANATFLRTGGFSMASRSPGNVEEDGYENHTMSGNLGYTLWEDVGAVDELSIRLLGRYTGVKTETDLDFAGPPEFFWQDSDHVIHRSETLLAAQVRAELLGGRLGTQFSGSLFQNGSLLQSSRGSFTEDENTGTVFGFDHQSTLRVPVAPAFLPEVALTLGFEAEKERGTFKNSTAVPSLTDNDINTAGAYGNLELPLFNRLFLTLAGRLEDHSRFGRVETHRASVALELPMRGAHRITKIRASRGTGFEAPSLQQLFVDGPFTVGNPDLKPEESDMWDLGVHFLLFDGRILGEVGYYEGWANNGIFSDFDPAQGVFVPYNLDSKVRMDGVELALSFFPSESLGFDVSHTWARSKAKDRFTGEVRQLFEQPKKLGSLHARFTFSPRWEFGFRATLRGDQWASYPQDHRMKGYTKVDFTTSLRVTQELTLYGRLDNLTDAAYEDRLGTGTAGRRVFVGLRARR